MVSASSEIPIFHILNARITFGNLNGCDEPVPLVRGSPSSETPSPGSDSSSVSSSSSTSETLSRPEPALTSPPHRALPREWPGGEVWSTLTHSPAPPASCRGCEISPALFEAPRGYSVLGGQREAATRDDDDDLLQFAIQQSLLEAGSEYDQVRPRGRMGPPDCGAATANWLTPASTQVTIWEALTNSKPGTHPMSYEGRRQDRSVPARPERVWRRLFPHLPYTCTENTRALSRCVWTLPHEHPSWPRGTVVYHHQGPYWFQDGVYHHHPFLTQGWVSSILQTRP